MDGDGTGAIAGKVEAWGREAAELRSRIERVGCLYEEERMITAALVEILRGIIDNPGLKAGTMPEQIALDYYVQKARRALAHMPAAAANHDELVRQRMLETWQKAARQKAAKLREHGAAGYLSAALALEEFADQMRTHATGMGQEPPEQQPPDTVKMVTRWRCMVCGGEWEHCPDKHGTGDRDCEGIPKPYQWPQS